MLHCCMWHAVYVTGSTVHAACCTSACTRAALLGAAQLGTCSQQLEPAGRRPAGARTRHAETNKPRRRRLRTAPAPWCGALPHRHAAALRIVMQASTTQRGPVQHDVLQTQRNTLQHIATRGGPCFGASCHCPETACACAVHVSNPATHSGRWQRPVAEGRDWPIRWPRDAPAPRSDGSCAVIPPAPPAPPCVTRKRRRAHTAQHSAAQRSAG